MNNINRTDFLKVLMLISQVLGKIATFAAMVIFRYRI